jgi:hypothetical protein
MSARRATSNMGRRVRTLGGLLSFGVGALVFTGAFTGTWVNGAPDVVPEAQAQGGSCQAACQSNAAACVKKCVVDQKPCLDKCKVDPDADPRHMTHKDSTCARACLAKSRPCQNGCQARRAACARGCPN